MSRFILIERSVRNRGSDSHGSFIDFNNRSLGRPVSNLDEARTRAQQTCASYTPNSDNTVYIVDDVHRCTIETWINKGGRPTRLAF